MRLANLTRISAIFCSVKRLCSREISTRHRHYWKNMDSDGLHPPTAIRGMRELNKDAFKKVVKVPKLVIPEDKLNQILPLVKKHLLKMERLKPVRTAPTQKSNGVVEGKLSPPQFEKEILLHPVTIKDWNSLPKDELTDQGINESHFGFEDLELSYENWRADELLKFILPDDQDALTSFSRIGHVVHVNLRDHLIPYKTVIGQILKDKTVGCRSVVNKTKNIDNAYRNFQLELLCGEPDYLVQTKENGTTFEFDFAKVYWNPRLSTEHERIVNLLKSGDVLYDVFAGVGPFSIPAAAKKKCTVLANDLNPESYKWLVSNAKRNKCQQRIVCCNKDGRDFIREDIRSDLANRWRNPDSENYNIHITMNLPAMAIEFLNEFNGLLANEDLRSDVKKKSYPLVHVYTFAKGEDSKALVQTSAEEFLGHSLDNDTLEGIHFVRNVAPNKDMYRVSFYLTDNILFGQQKRPSDHSTGEPSPKKLCI